MRESFERQFERQIPQSEWALYRRVLVELKSRSIRSALGGGFAWSYYSGMWRDTKDMDLYILRSDRETAIEVLHAAGFEDYHDRAPYDRGWIYRGYQQGVIVDLIWCLANYRADVTEDWLVEPQVRLKDMQAAALGPEELIFCKLYVIQRERCDWPDLLSLLHAQAPTLRWERLLELVGADVGLVRGLLCVFSWLCPQRAGEAPAWVWERLGLARPEPGPRCDESHERVKLLDARPWFAPLVRETGPTPEPGPGD
jgi:hypothetical protein